MTRALADACVDIVNRGTYGGLAALLAPESVFFVLLHGVRRRAATANESIRRGTG
jgi:hypothetical protein